MTGELRTISFTAPKPDLPITLNERLHHFDRYRRDKTWQEAAFWWAKQHKVNCRGANYPIEVYVEFGTNRPNQRRDPHNFVPTIKAICDGFTKAGVWPDDDSKHVHTSEPTFTNTIRADSLRITLTWSVADG